MPAAELSQLDQLSNRLKAAKTAKELRTIATQADFQEKAGALKADETEQLRALYREIANAVRNVVKAEELSGIPILVNRARPVDTQNGLTYYLTGVRIESNTPFECFAPGTSISDQYPQGGPGVRFFHRLPKNDFPVRCVMVKGPHPTDSKKTLWQVDRIHDVEQTSFIPF